MRTGAGPGTLGAGAGQGARIQCCAQRPPLVRSAFSKIQKVLQKGFYHLFNPICYDDALVLLHITKG